MNTRRYIDSQFDLFILSLTEFQLRDSRETMERPFFSLAKRKRLKPIEYESDDVWVKVEPHQNYGMATIWDADILIWAASALIDMKNRGVNDIPNELHFQPYDLLKSIKRSTGGEHYTPFQTNKNVLVGGMRGEHSFETLLIGMLKTVDSFSLEC